MTLSDQQRAAHLDLFSGIGGFALAAERAGFVTVAHAEIEPFPCRVLARHWPDVPNLGNVEAIDGRSIVERFGPIDLVTFGSPCQDLSVAGKRSGLAGARSGLFYEAIRIIRNVRPAFAVFENVPGLFSSNRGCDFGAVLDSLADIGAVDIAWRVLDAQFFGVPQRRRRIFVVADFRGERAAQILFESEGVSRHSSPRQQTGQDVASCLRSGAVGGRSHGKVNGTDQMPMVVANSLNGNSGRRQVEETYVPDISSPLTEGYAKSAFNDGKRGVVPNVVAGFRSSSTNPLRANQIEAVCVSENQRAEVRLTETCRPLTSGGGKPGQGYAAVAISLRGREGGATAELGGEQSPSMRASQGGGDKPHALTQMGVRRLTPRECERLMGLPDDWTAISGAKDGPRYRALGNAVAVPVVEWILRRIADVLGQSQERAA